MCLIRGEEYRREQIREEEFYFYFIDLGGYPVPGDSVSALQSRLNPYRDIYNIPEVKNRLDRSLRRYERQNGALWAENILMGDKFEAARILGWAESGNLISATPK